MRGVTVSTELPEPPVIVPGANAHVACVPVRPVNASETFPPKPFCGETETVYDALVPASTVIEVGLAVSVKVAAA